MEKLIVGIGGSSGSIYARLLLERLSVLRDQVAEVGIVMSRNAVTNWQLENKEKTLNPMDLKYMPRMTSMRLLLAGLHGIRP